MKNSKNKNEWLFEINSNQNSFNFDLKTIWRYKDLLWLFVKRDIVTLYKQTILGPLWYFIQPLFTMVIFTVIFNKVAGISTNEVPPYLFNLAGIISWNYFKDCLDSTSDTFKSNEKIFSKVYFPRIIMPISIVISNLLKFSIQFLIFIGFYLYYVFFDNYQINVNINIILLPIVIIFMALLSLGLGMIFSSLITKYRDMKFLLSFGIQLLMYISAVFYPMSAVLSKMPKFAWVVKYNPIAHIIETTRFILLGTGNISLFGILYTTIITVFIFIVGLIIFNKTEKTFIDTI